MGFPFQHYILDAAGQRPGDGTCRALLRGEIAINRADGMLCWLDPSGTLHATPLLALVTSGTLAAALAAYARLTDVDDKVAAAVASLVASSPATLNTLKELADALGDDPHFAATTASALGFRLRFDALQGLTGQQQAQGRSNLAAAAAGANNDITSLGGLTARPSWATFTPFDTGNLNPVRSGNNAIQYNWDGGSVRLIIDNTDQGRVYTDKVLVAAQVDAIVGRGALWGANTLSAGAVFNIIGYQPTRNYAAGAHSIGFTWDGTNVIPVIDGNGGLGVLWGQTNLNAAQLNGIAGQTLYGTGNLSAAQIGAILGYTPGRVTTPFATSSSGAGDLGMGAATGITAVSFTATGTSALVIANAKVFHNTANAPVNEVQINVDIYDNTAGGVAAQGIAESANVSYGQGFVILSCQLVTGSLVAGRSYTARMFMSKGRGDSATPCSACVLGGFNA